MMSKVVILALETSGDVASVALMADGALLYAREFHEVLKGGSALAPGVAEALALGYAPTAVAVGAGPGSYTGTRIGVTYAKMFAFARGLPLFAVPGPEALARAEGIQTGIVAVAMAAHPGRIYGAAYDVGSSPPRVVVAPALMILDNLIALAGTAPCVDVPPARVTAMMVAAIAHERLVAGMEGDDMVALEPLYLQASAPERKANP